MSFYSPSRRQRAAAGTSSGASKPGGVAGGGRPGTAASSIKNDSSESFSTPGAVGQVVVLLPDETKKRVDFTLTTRVYHVLGKMAKELGVGEYEAKQWKAVYPGTMDLIPINQRIVGMPPYQGVTPPAPAIGIDAPPLSAPTDSNQSHHVTLLGDSGTSGLHQGKGTNGPKATPRDPLEEQTTMMSITLLLKPINAASRSSQGGGSRHEIPPDGMTMRVAVNCNEPASNLRMRVDSLGFAVDPSHLLCADKRVVVGEHHTFRELRISRETQLSYVPPTSLSPKRARSSMSVAAANRSYGASGISSAKRNGGQVANITTTSSTFKSPRGPYDDTSLNYSSTTATGGGGAVPPLNFSSNSSLARNRGGGVTSSNSTAIRSPRGANQPVQVSNVGLHVTSPSRTTLIQQPPSGVISVNFKDPEDQGYCYQITAQVQRKVGSLLEFVSYPDRYEIRCDGEVVDPHSTFLIVTRGIPGCLFTLHERM